jgi:hypothetical protein
MKARSSAVAGAAIVPNTVPPPVKGFQMISVTSLSKERKESAVLDDANQVNGVNGSLPTESTPASGDTEDGEVEIAEETTQDAVQRLFGDRNVGEKPTGLERAPNGVPTGRGTALGQFTDYPEMLQLTEDTPAVPPSNTDLATATASKQAQGDIQTVFFINFPPNFADDDIARQNLVEIDDLVKSWQSWSSVLCEGKVQDMMNAKKLPGDDSAAAMSARSTYRSKIFDYLMRNATW